MLSARTSAAPTTRRGAHGTLYLFRCHYRADEHTTLTSCLWAYDAEHAEERFLGGEPDAGWELVRVERVRRSPC